MSELIQAATSLRWFNTQYVGLDQLPIQTLQTRNVIVTNGAGLNAITISEYVVMGMLTIAKGYRDVVHAQGRHEWLTKAPGVVELAGTRALVIGYGAIGQLVTKMLSALDVEVSVVRRSGGGGSDTLGPDEWRKRLGEFDWVILAVPSTPETLKMISADELASMKPTAALINVARGNVIDQEALVKALREGVLGGAFLDVTTPEPLPPTHELWTLKNAHVSMHLSGRSQNRMAHRVSRRFLDNLIRYADGTRLQNAVDLARGY
ncbi:D-2-hydroxyacid dehydrogenase [Polaromonas sp. P1(28)-8]|nr:D-2-hydroxyacid dehydrogenase [Polaromonas sp. P1(28)-8]